MKMTLKYERDSLIDEMGHITLKQRYLLKSESSPQDMFWRVAAKYGEDSRHTLRLYSYFSRHWIMPSTPILSNGGTTKGLPISCYLNYIHDSREGITGHYTENAFLSSLGGGIGGYIGDVRSNGTPTSHGSESTGIIPFIKVIDSEVLAFSQGVTRRGAYAIYNRIDHPEIEEFLDIKKTTGGDINRKCPNLFPGVVITDEFMEKIDQATKVPGFDDSFDLVDPHTKKVVKTVSAKALWIKLLINRMETGSLFIVFEKAIGDGLPESLKALGLKVHHSNLCTEITLPTNEERTAVCCLSSINIAKYGEYKNRFKQVVEDLTLFLDNVLEDFITNAPPQLKKAVTSAVGERSIGMGALGLHTYFQKNRIMFDSVAAKSFNNFFFKKYKEYAVEASIKLAEKKGTYQDAGDLDNKRHAHLLAVAPNASTSILAGNISPSIEPMLANAFVKKTKSGTFVYKNPEFEKVLQALGKDEDKIWKSICSNKGSVQHLDFLDQETKDIFKTAYELDQRWIIDLAGDRQKHICQAQSLNIFLPSNAHVAEMHNIHMLAWKKNLKTLYYLRSMSLQRTDDLNKKIEREYLIDYESSCVACEG